MRRSVRISAVHNAFAKEPKTIHRITQTTPSRLLGSGLVPLDFAPIAKREGDQEHVSQVLMPRFLALLSAPPPD